MKNSNVSHRSLKSGSTTTPVLNGRPALLTLTERPIRFRLPALLLIAILALTSSESGYARHKKRKSILGQAQEQVQKAWNEATVSPPKDHETCFSPEEPCDIKLVKFIDSAKTSIDVAVFDFTLDEAAHHLLVAAKKMPVRIVVDRRQAKGEHSLVPMLIKAGANVRIGSQRGIMHNKFMIVDRKMVETGSYNYTFNASANNNENQIYLANPEVVDRFAKRFDRIWSQAKPVRSD